MIKALALVPSQGADSKIKKKTALPPWTASEIIIT